MVTLSNNTHFREMGPLNIPIPAIMYFSSRPSHLTKGQFQDILKDVWDGVKENFGENIKGVTLKTSMVSAEGKPQPAFVAEPLKTEQDLLNAAVMYLIHKESGKPGEIFEPPFDLD